MGLIIGGIVLYLFGIAVGSYIKGRFFYWRSDDLATFLIGVWPLTITLAIPVGILIGLITLVVNGAAYIVDLGYRHQRAKEMAEENRQQAVERVENIEMFEDTVI